MTTTTKSTPAKGRTKPVLTLGADLSPAVAAIEAAYRIFQAEYPDAPPVTIVVKRDEKAWGHTTIAKVWAPAKAKGAATRFEIMISGENLRRGGEAVASTLIHEAAHARNLSKGILDTDSNGRHNMTFKKTAEDQGLTISNVGWHGWTGTAMSPEGAKRWKKMIATIDRGLAKSAATADVDLSHLPGVKGKNGKPGPAGKGGTAVAPPKRGNRNLIKAVCQCPEAHSIRVSQGVLDKAQPKCSVCEQVFAAVESK